MAKLKLREGYSLIQKVEGEGIVKIFAHKIDGSVEDVEVAKIVSGKYEIEEGKVAKLIYQVIQSLDRFGVYASESGVPADEDYDITADSALADYIEVENGGNADEHVPESEPEEDEE